MKRSSRRDPKDPQTKSERSSFASGVTMTGVRAHRREERRDRRGACDRSRCTTHSTATAAQHIHTRETNKADDNAKQKLGSLSYSLVSIALHAARCFMLDCPWCWSCSTYRQSALPEAILYTYCMVGRTVSARSGKIGGTKVVLGLDWLPTNGRW